MMPSLPVADFVIRQARLAFGALEAFLHAVFGFGDASELGLLLQVRLEIVVAQGSAISSM